MGKEREPLTVVLEIDPQSNPISGAIRVGDRRRAFSGWMELTERLEQMRRGATWIESANGGGGTQAPPAPE